MFSIIFLVRFKARRVMLYIFLSPVVYHVVHATGRRSQIFSEKVFSIFLRFSQAFNHEEFRTLGDDLLVPSNSAICFVDCTILLEIYKRAFQGNRNSSERDYWTFTRGI